MSGEKKQQPSFKSDMQQLIAWGPTFKSVMQKLMADGTFGEKGKETYKDLQLEVVDDEHVRISFGKTSGEGIESSPSQGPPAKGQMKGRRDHNKITTQNDPTLKRHRDHNKITTQNDSTSDGDKMDDINKRKKGGDEWLTGFAACQMCGELWVCDGRIDKPNHIHPLHVSRMFHFVCPSGACTKNPLLACKLGRPVYP